VLSGSSTLHERAEIDFTEVFSASYAEETVNLLCYFGKSLGCCIANASVEPPPALRHMAFLKSRRIGRVRMGLAVYYNFTQFEKAWRRKHTPSRRTENLRSNS